MITKSNVCHMLQIGLVLSQFLPGTLLSVEAARLVYENTFETGLGDTRKQGNPQQPAGCESQKFGLASDPEGGRNQAFQFWQPGGQECLTADGKHRAFVWLENPETGKLFTYGQHTHYFVGYRVYLPPDFPTAYLDNSGVSVIHLQLARNDQGETPRFVLLSKDGVTAQLEVSRQYRDDRNQLVQADRTTVDLVKGAWNSIVFHVKHESDSTGVFEMWVNDVKVINWQNVRTASNPAQQPSGTTNNFGLYWGKQDRPADFRIYIDDYRVAEGADGFDLVNPTRGVTRPTPPIGSSPAPLPVSIDIKPGRNKNRIDPRSESNVKVAILTSDSFDADTIDVSTIQFGPGNAKPVRYRLDDIDGDTDWDLVLWFRTQDTGIACGDTESTLTARTLDGNTVTGTDTLKTVRCN